MEVKDICPLKEKEWGCAIVCGAGVCKEHLFDLLNLSYPESCEKCEIGEPQKRFHEFAGKRIGSDICRETIFLQWFRKQEAQHV